MSGYQFLPPLSDAELAALRDSIVTFGILQPVITDEAGDVLDGHHRAAIAAELGMEYPRTVLAGLSEEQKIEQAILLNLGRRHLDAEQRRAIVRDLRARGLSIRWISERTAIPRSTVARLAESPVPNGTPEYVGGLDGKRYRAHRPAAEYGDPDGFRDHLRSVLGIVGELPVTVPEFRRYLAEGSRRFGLGALAEQIEAESDERIHSTLLDWLHDCCAKVALRTGEVPFPLHLVPVQGRVDEKTVEQLGSIQSTWARTAEGRAGEFLAWADGYGSALEFRNAAASWSLVVKRRAGAFLNWCEEVPAPANEHTGEWPKKGKKSRHDRRVTFDKKGRATVHPDLAPEERFHVWSWLGAAP